MTPRNNPPGAAVVALVLDASIFTNWCVEDELGPVGGFVMRLSEGLVAVPRHRAGQVADGIPVGEWRGRAMFNRRLRPRALLDNLDIEVDAEGIGDALLRILPPARAPRLTVGGAGHPEPAERRGGQEA